MTPVVVDVHCHNFNADDLPLEGFVRQVLLGSSDPELGSLLATLVNHALQKRAPGFEEEMTRIRRLLAGDEPTVFEQRLSDDIATDALEWETLRDLVSLDALDPVFIRRLSHALHREIWGVDGGTAGGSDAATESLEDRWQDAVRAFRWAKMFGRSRLDLTSAMVNTFKHPVDLFCPLLVDLGLGLGDRPNTTARQQLEMAEGISLLSMKGKLPGGSTAKLHPFIGFDPRRQVRAVQGGIGETPLDLVKDAVQNHGFVGVKVYPSMGWRPIGNRTTPDMPGSEALLVDKELRRFYKWCEEAEVPITSHANHSNYASPAYREYGGPSDWQSVLDDFPDLHLNLGHFGGARVTEDKAGWPRDFARLASRYKNVFADVGNHKIYDSRVRSSYFAQLERLYDDPTTAAMKDRLMYGSDWYMLALYPGAESFLANYRTTYQEHFGQDSTDKFMGQNALQFLGFGNAGNANNRRLREYYQRHGVENVPHWLTGP